MTISAKDIHSIADLAGLGLTEAECTNLQEDLGAILDYIAQLSELDTSNVEPMAQVPQIAAAEARDAHLRADELSPSLPRSAALSNAPLSCEMFFRVPKVIER